MDIEDDETILDDSVLWRRIPPDQVVPGNDGGKRPSTKAFQNPSDGSGMSVNIAADTTVERTLKDYEDYYLVGFSAGFIRTLSQGVIRKPLPEEPAHAEVNGAKSKSIKKQFSKGCVWVVHPPSE